jgi:hypothetical protein
MDMAGLITAQKPFYTTMQSRASTRFIVLNKAIHAYSQGASISRFGRQILSIQLIDMVVNLSNRKAVQ